MYALSSDRLQMVKLYPEGDPEARLNIAGVKKLFLYCNKDGLFRLDLVHGIDDRDRSHDDTKERMELEETAKKLFG